MTSFTSFFTLSLTAVLCIAGATFAVAAVVIVLILALRKRKYKYTQLLTMEELVARGKDLLAKKEGLHSVIFVHMSPDEIPERQLPRRRIPEEVRHVILATSEENGQVGQILDVILCAKLEEALAANLPLEIER